MDLHHSDERGVEVVGFGLLGVKNFDRVRSTGNRKDLGAKPSQLRCDAEEKSGPTGQPKKYSENFSASRVAEVTMSLRSGRRLRDSERRGSVRTNSNLRKGD